MLDFEQGLMSATALDQTAAEPSIPGRTRPWTRRTPSIKLVRWLADTATLFETDMVPYWLALLEWTLPVVVFRQCQPVAEAVRRLQRRAAVRGDPERGADVERVMRARSNDVRRDAPPGSHVTLTLRGG